MKPNSSMFRSLFVWWSELSRSRIFHSYGDVTIAREGLQILTNARHSWPLSSEGSLTCHTYCDTGLPFVMFISEDPWHLNLLPSVWQWSCHYLFLRIRSVATGDRTLTSRTRGESSTSTPPRRLKHVIWSRHSRCCVEWSLLTSMSFKFNILSFWQDIYRCQIPM